MPLQKQLVQIPFKGLQTKVDPKIAPLGTYATINNMIMNRYPELIKRDGLSLLGGVTTPSNINASYNYLNEVGVITNNSLYSYSPSLDQYQLKGLTASPIVTAKPVIANTYTQTVCDGYIANDSILGCAWEDSREGVRCSIKDMVSDTFLNSDYLLSSTGVKPKVLAVANYLFFFWVEPGTTTLTFVQYNTITNTFLSPNNISTSLASCYTYDIIKSAGNILIVVAETTAVPNALKAYYWDVNGQKIGDGTDGLQIPTSLNFSNSGATPPAISLAVNDANTYFTCTVYNNLKQIYTKSFLSFTTALTSEIQVSSATTDSGWALSSCVDSSNNTYIFYSSYSTLHNSFQAKVSSNITTPSVVYNRSFYLQMGVVSKAFYYSGNAYVVLGYTSSLQNTYFGVREDGACFGRLFATVGGGNIAKANCVSSFSIRPDRSNTYVLPLLKTTKIVSSTTSFFSTTSVFTEQIYFTPQSIDNKVLGKFLNIAGGYLKQYDGSQTVFEQGFHLYPEQPTLVAASGGSIVNGTYAYLACWEWTDNQGQVHRSEPSVATNITTSGSNQTVNVTVRTLPITNKETRFGDLRTPVVLAVYRTLAGGTTYYRVNQLVSEYVYNDPTVQTITYSDTKADTSIQSNSLLYTTGGVFQNIGLPSTNLMCVGKNRVIVAGTDTEPNRVFFSKEKEEGIALEFSNELSFIVDSLGGDITALAAMDDKILIFKKSLIYYVAGQGPDKLGNGSFSIPQLVSADCGCTAPQSIVLTGKGIMFESQKGIYLIDRQLSVTYIGQQLDLITTKNPSFQITSAVNLPDQNLVYFTDINNQVLVYDTYFENWYTYSLAFSPISSTLLNNSWYVNSTSQVYSPVAGQTYDGNNLAIISSIKTNWISLAQLEGFARIYTILIVGDNANLAHRLRVNLYYDFEQFPREQLSIIPTSLIDSTYGNSATYGSDSPYGGTFDGTYQFVIRPKEQKCSSIQIEIFDDYPDGSRTSSFKFSGLSLVVGIKQGWNKNLSYTRRLT